jgi:hypothetical protein
MKTLSRHLIYIAVSISLTAITAMPPFSLAQTGQPNNHKGYGQMKRNGATGENVDEVIDSKDDC